MSQGIPTAAPSRTLKTVLAERGALPAKVGLAIFRQLLRQVRALHAGGATHRAIGPDTVLLDATGRATLVAAEPVRELDRADAESCPPELAGAGIVRLPADIEAARQELSGPASPSTRAGSTSTSSARCCASCSRARRFPPTCAVRKPSPGFRRRSSR